MNVCPSKGEEYAEKLRKADSYFYNHIDNDTWAEACEDKRLRALLTAEREIENLPINKNGDSQRIEQAVYEQALFRMQVNGKRELLQAQGVKSAGIAHGAQEAYGEQMFGIAVAPRAKLLLMGQFAIGVTR